MPEQDNPDDFLAIVTSELRARPPGTVANVTDFAVAYWSGSALKGFFLRDDGSYALDEEFEFNDLVIDQWWSDLADWLAMPVFSDSPEVRAWVEEGKP